MRYTLAALLAGLLVAVPVLCSQMKDRSNLSREDRLKEIRADYKAFAQKLEEQFREAANDQQREKLQKEFQAASPFVEQALELANENLTDEIGYQALAFALSVGPRNEKADKVVELLLANHINNPLLARAIPLLTRREGEGATKFLEGLVAKSKDSTVQGVATFFLATTFADESDFLEGREKAKSDELAEKSLKLFDDIQSKYAEVKIDPRAPSIGEMAKGRVFELKNLRIGMTAPDSESKTLNGKTVKVSELRGKVVVLDFWATWCGPCVQLIPEMRQIAAKYKSRPFELVSISADDEPGEVEAFLKETSMPWTHWHSGQEAGIIRAWNVRSFPTIYVLDAKGVIRAKEIFGEALDKEIGKLLSEINSTPSNG